MTNKMTYAVALNTVLTNGEMTDEVRETLERLLESVNKRNARKSTSDKPTKKQVENEGVKAQIREVLRNATEPMTCKAVGEALSLSPQKESPLLKQMKFAGEVARSEGKGKVALFALADSETDGE